MHGAGGTRRWVFVLDEFDLLARHAKQTLLYNLLDTVQASNVQVPSPPLPLGA